jgi:type IV pilus assembly protein PilO
MVLVTILAFGLVGLFWYFVYDPKSGELDKLALHVDSLDDMNQKAKSEMAKGTVEQIREQAKASRENLDLMRTLVPAANEVYSLIDQVSSAARRARLDVGALEPEPPIDGELFDTFRYRMKICGSYNDLAQMLTNIGSLNRIVTAINLQLTLPQGCAGQPGKQVLSSSFEIQTYVVRTAPRKGAAKKPPVSGGATPPPTPPPAPAGSAPPVPGGAGRGKPPGDAQ